VGARREADKEAVDAYEAHRLILCQIRQLAEWTASLRVRKLRLKLHPGRVGPGGGAGLRYNLLRVDEQGKKLLALESSARAEAFRLLLATVERAGEEARLAAEVNGLQLMVEGQTQDDLVDSDGELCFEDPRQAAWADLPQDPREVPKDEAVLALRSLVRAARAGVETTAGELAAATTSWAGLAKKQSKVFDPGGGL
jgi:hypothetical protein